MAASQKKLVLIVEDEPQLAAVISEYLQQSDFATHIINDGLQVIPYIKESLPSLILLDLMLPGQRWYVHLQGGSQFFQCADNRGNRQGGRDRSSAWTRAWGG